MILIVLRGLPGSGKSTFTENLLNLDITGQVISNDNLRKIGNNYSYIMEDNNKIYQENNKKLLELIKKKEKLIIIDNCNLNSNMLDYYAELSKKYDYRYYQLSFDKPNRNQLYISFKNSTNGISFSSYKSLYSKYQHHYLDIKIKDFNKENFIEIYKSL